jgi:hypothetical protein
MAAELTNILLKTDVKMCIVQSTPSKKELFETITPDEASTPHNSCKLHLHFPDAHDQDCSIDTHGALRWRW